MEKYWNCSRNVYKTQDHYILTFFLGFLWKWKINKYELRISVCLPWWFELLKPTPHPPWTKRGTNKQHSHLDVRRFQGMKFQLIVFVTIGPKHSLDSFTARLLKCRFVVWTLHMLREGGNHCSAWLIWIGILWLFMQHFSNVCSQPSRCPKVLLKYIICISMSTYG